MAIVACVLIFVGGGSVAPLAQPTGPDLTGEVVRVVMQQQDGQLVVPVTLDGQGPFAFRLDTGSDVPLAIDADLARQLAASRSAPAGEPGLSIARLELGGAVFHDVVALERGDAEAETSATVQGVLGFPFFHEVLLTVDYAGGVIELRHGGLTSDSEDVVPLVGSKGTPQVAMQVGDRVYHARLDTGFADNVALPLAAAGEVGTEGAPATVGRVQADGRMLEALSARLTQPLLVAGRRYDRLPVLFADLPSGPRLGYGLLAYFTLTFDQAAGLVRITPSGAAG
jgi:hypothetical protein